MILKALKYTRYKGAPREWSIEGPNSDYAYFDNINLLVGKNASGKSRTLNVMREIGNLLSGRINLKSTISPTESFDLIFKNEKGRYRYLLEYKNQIVSSEILYVDNKKIIDREKKILKSLDGEDIHFEIEDYELCISKLDSAENPYYEKFVLWGNTLRKYLFANQIEKNSLVKTYTELDDEDPGDEGADLLINTFHQGCTLFGDSFIEEVISVLRNIMEGMDCL